jgi:hypothetical protein
MVASLCRELGVQCLLLRFCRCRLNVEVVKESFENFQAPLRLLWFNVNDLERGLVIDWMR